MKACFQIAECSLSYAKIRLFREKKEALKQNDKPSYQKLLTKSQKEDDNFTKSVDRFTNQNLSVLATY